MVPWFSGAFKKVWKPRQVLSEMSPRTLWLFLNTFWRPCSENHQIALVPALKGCFLRVDFLNENEPRVPWDWRLDTTEFGPMLFIYNLKVTLTYNQPKLFQLYKRILEDSLCWSGRVGLDFQNWQSCMIFGPVWAAKGSCWPNPLPYQFY